VRSGSPLKAMGFPERNISCKESTLAVGIRGMDSLFKICAALWALALPAAAADVPPVLPIGATAPAFSLPGIDGKTYTQGDFKAAKVLCVVFICNHCPDAVAASGRLQKIHEDYKDKGVAIVGVNANNAGCLTPDELAYAPYSDSQEEMVPHAKDFGWTFPYLYDGEKQEFANACGAQSTPHVFLFDADRKLRYTGRMDDGGRNPAAVDKSYLRDALDAVLTGKEVAEKTTRSFGCSTKWLAKKANVAADQAAWEKRAVTVADLNEELSKKIRANDSKRVRLIDFWSTTCGPCVKDFPEMVETARRFQNRPMDFISISVDPVALRGAVEDFLKSKFAAMPDSTAKAFESQNLPSNNYHWTGGNPDLMAQAIDPEWSGALPHLVLVGPGGKILWRHNGEASAVEVRRQLVKALDEL
jgi:thiol-disulfide isomerase/thioredoxin